MFRKKALKRKLLSYLVNRVPLGFVRTTFSPTAERIFSLFAEERKYFGDAYYSITELFVRSKSDPSWIRPTNEVHIPTRSRHIVFGRLKKITTLLTILTKVDLVR